MFGLWFLGETLLSVEAAIAMFESGIWLLGKWEYRDTGARLTGDAVNPFTLFAAIPLPFDASRCQMRIQPYPDPETPLSGFGISKLDCARMYLSVILRASDVLKSRVTS